MLEKLKERVKNWMQKTGAETGLSKEFKDIFEVGGVPAFNQFYYFGIFIWKYLYKGFYSPWHRILAPTIENPRNRRDLERMDVAKAVSSELAGLIWSEQCEVHVSQSDSEEQPLEEFVHDVLTKNGFWTKMQEHIEQVLALGGGAIKAWYEVKRDGAGNEIPETEEYGWASAWRISLSLLPGITPRLRTAYLSAVRQRTAIIIPGWNGINGTG